MYRTIDFVEFEWLGEVLSEKQRLPGTVFRPHLLYNTPSQQFVMWYENRWSNGTTNPGYSVATAPAPHGPYSTINPSVVLSGKGRVGDFDLFIDDDGVAYHVRTGLVIERLDSTYTRGTADIYSLPLPSVEGPSMFKRGSTYYVLVGVGCCACKGGSNILVYTSSSPLGPYTLQGDVGSNSSQPFDLHSPFNYVTHAQQSEVVEVKGVDGDPQYLWVGTQWLAED